jgi:Na+-translocating ferredoxin:NAD+ oxidoreductase RnfE subunit
MLLSMPPGFFELGLVIAVIQYISIRKKEKKNKGGNA